jgi:hypothetical protein
VCSDASEEQPILKCDGVHETEVGYHLDCLPSGHRLDEMPADDEEWLCPKCRDGNLWIVAEIRGKKKAHRNNRCVHYLCHWRGYGTDEDTFEPLVNIPQQARDMVREFNRKELVRRRAEEPAPAGGKKSK